MRRLALCLTVVLVGCGRAEEERGEELGEGAVATGEAPAGVALSEVAGKWNMHSTDEAGKPVVSFILVATPERSGWSLNFPNRDPVPLEVDLVDGDSIVTTAGPYESVLRKGVQVTVRSVFRLQDGKLVGPTTARYETTGADSVVRLQSEGTRAP